ncbi:MAG TPA: hypothetical protein VF746_24560 [Longimicrobium sp.]|jgi:hypothetical protein
MPKLKLDLNALEVESFDTTLMPRRAGTVRGHYDAAAGEPVAETDWETCWGTCEGGETCCTPGCDTNEDSCWGTCEISCYGSCVHTCESNCTKNYTVCPTGFPVCCAIG